MADLSVGRIINSNGGFYYVETAGSVITECRARGIFRKNGISPLVGDEVRFSVAPTGEGSVEEILPRKNFFNRPPCANIDMLICVSSVADPAPNQLVNDRMTVCAERRGVVPVMLFSKTDIKTAEYYVGIYEKAGMISFGFSAETGENIDRIRTLLKDRVCVLTGNSGVGKSSLLNALDPSLSLATAGISDKLGRGRHTTRTVTLYKLCGGLVADTPGFSVLDFENDEHIPPDELAYLFPEFLPYLGDCRFGSSCAHVKDKGCAVTEAVQNGLIARERWESYTAMYAEATEVENRKWDR